MTWMIGFKLNENSNLMCGLRMLANIRSIPRLQRWRDKPRDFNGAAGMTVQAKTGA
jgi:hypothetical protein